MAAAQGSTMEQPFSLNFQAETLRSGSISFGRYEAESLSWERWSTFSQNRYLEEFEKFSKPGSVTEMKAYFEAHFRKKALLRESSSVSPDETEYKMNENNVADGLVDGENTDHDNIEGSHLVHFNRSPDHSAYNGECQEIKFEGGNVGISYVEHHPEPSSDKAALVHFDRSPDHSDYNGECQEIKFEGGNVGISYVEHHREPVSDKAACARKSENQAFENSLSDSMDKSIEIESAYNEGSHMIHFEECSDGSGYVGESQDINFRDGNTETVYSGPLIVPSSSKPHHEVSRVDDTDTGCGKLISVNTEPDIGMKQNLNEEPAIANELLEAINMPSRSQEVEKHGQLISEQGQTHSTKDSQGMKHNNPRSNSKASFTEIRGSTLSQTLNNNAKICGRREAVDLVGKSKVKQPLQTSFTATHSKASFTEIRGSMLSQTLNNTAKIYGRREAVDLLGKSKVKQSFQTSFTDTHSISHTIKHQKSESMKAKLHHETTCDKDVKAKKVAAPRPSTPGRIESRVRKSANRFPQTLNVNSTNQGISRSAATLNFKCDEEAENTKEESETLKTKLVEENKSDKELRVKKVVAPRPSTPGKFESQKHQTVNRPVKTLNSDNQYTRQRAAAFNIKSKERAEKMKRESESEEKLRAKEAGKNHIQIRTQERTETENGQFRRSLNFKAIPMPSFYQEGTLQGSGGKKDESANGKAAMPLSRSSMLRKPVTPNLAYSKKIDFVSTNNDRLQGTMAQDRSSQVTPNTTCLREIDSVSTNDHRLQALGSTNCHSVPMHAVSPMKSSRNRSCPAEAGRRNRTAAAKIRRERKETSSQSQEYQMRRKGQHVEFEQKIGTRSSSVANGSA